MKYGAYVGTTILRKERKSLLNKPGKNYSVISTVPTLFFSIAEFPISRTSLKGEIALAKPSRNTKI